MADCSIPGNPDIAGIGVRIAIYIQNLLCFLPALWALWDGKVTQDELESAETQTTTNLVLAFAILISSIVQALTLGLSSYHANIVLSMSWMNNTNVFIYFLLYIHHKRHTITPDWRSWYRHVREKMDFVLPRRGTRNEGVRGLESDGSGERDSATDPGGRKSAKVLVKRVVILLGSLHLTLMAGLGIWLWSNLLSFGNHESVQPNNCAATSAFVAIVGQAVPMGANALKICSLILYSIFLIPGINLVLPVALFLCLNFWCHRLSLTNESSGTSQRKQWVALPAIFGLILLLIINIIFIVDIETTLIRNKDLQGEGEEAQWGFGQILAVLLLFLPLRDLVETLLARRAKRFQKVRQREIAADLTGALRSKEFNAVLQAMERGADLQEALNAENNSATEWLCWVSLSKGHHGVVAALVQRPAVNVNLVDETGRTPLDVVCRSDEVGPLRHEILGVLLQRLDINPNTVNSHGRTVLMDACSQGDKSAVELLLQHPRTNINQVSGGHTALLLASKAGQASVIRLLLEHADIDVNQTVDGRTTALMEACQGGHEGAVNELLASSSIMVNLQREDGSTALSIALEQDHQAVAALLLRHSDINVSLRNDQGQTPLMIAAVHGDEELVKVLLANSSSTVNFQDKRGNTALALATEHRQGAVVTLILQHPGVDLRDQSALFIGCQAGAEKAVTLLLESRSFNLQNEDEYNSLMVALENGHDAVAAHLLQALDTDIRIPHEKHHTLFLAACQKGAEQSARLIFERHLPDVSSESWGEDVFAPLMLALENGHDSVAAYLLQALGIDIDVPHEQYQALLLAACQGGAERSINLLLERQPPDVSSWGEDGLTPLMIALNKGQDDVAMLLLQHPRIDVNSFVGNGRYLLTAACRGGAEQSVKLLLDCYSLDINLGLGRDAPLMLALEHKHDALAARLLQRADINIQLWGWEDKTPLMIACENGLRESTRLLLEKDSSIINLHDNLKETALMLAADCGHQDIVLSLLHHPDINVDLEDMWGRTAAQRNEIDPEIRRLLEAHKPTQRL